MMGQATFAEPHVAPVIPAEATHREMLASLPESDCHFNSFFSLIHALRLIWMHLTEYKFEVPGGGDIIDPRQCAPYCCPLSLVPVR